MVSSSVLIVCAEWEIYVSEKYLGVAKIALSSSVHSKNRQRTSSCSYQSPSPHLLIRSANLYSPDINVKTVFLPHAQEGNSPSSSIIPAGIIGCCERYLDSGLIDFGGLDWRGLRGGLGGG